MESVDVQSVSQVLVAGDTPNDLRVGANAGVSNVAGVLTSAHDVASPSKEPHTHILASAATIPEVLGLDVVLLAVVLVDAIDAHDHAGLASAPPPLTRRSHRSKNQLPMR